jgi:hypothetical protein
MNFIVPEALGRVNAQQIAPFEIAAIKANSCRFPFRVQPFRESHGGLAK